MQQNIRMEITCPTSNLDKHAFHVADPLIVSLTYLSSHTTNLSSPQTIVDFRVQLIDGIQEFVSFMPKMTAIRPLRHGALIFTKSRYGPRIPI
jgi:hypothetical protein